jgi:hypothetical protein
MREWRHDQELGKRCKVSGDERNRRQRLGVEHGKSNLKRRPWQSGCEVEGQVDGYGAKVVMIPAGSTGFRTGPGSTSRITTRVCT